MCPSDVYAIVSHFIIYKYNIYIYTPLPGQPPGYNYNKKPFLGYNCNKKLYTAQGRLNSGITAQIWKLLLITTKVSNHTKALNTKPIAMRQG